jgi:hypothetical protein
VGKMDNSLTVAEALNNILKKGEVYLLQPGENVGILAKRWGVTEEQIFEANEANRLRERASKLQIGEKINRPESIKNMSSKLKDLPIQTQIDYAARKANVDLSLFRAMIQVESENCTKNVSRVGAIGCGQLMPTIIKAFDIDPHDTAENLTASAFYLSSLIKTAPGEGDERVWNALMMYNWGPTNFKAWYNSGMQPSKLTPEAKNHPLKIFRILGKDIPRMYKDLYTPLPMTKKR